MERDRYAEPFLDATMRIRYAAKTDVGMKRTHNEDYFSLIEDEQLFLVADGMGGHASGEVASKMAAEVIHEFFSRSKVVRRLKPLLRIRIQASQMSAG